MKFLEFLINGEKNFISKIVDNNTYLKVISLVIAGILFFILNGSGILDIDSYLNKTDNVDGIALKASVPDDKIIYGLPQTMTVKVQGSSAKIKKFQINKKNVIANLNLSVCQNKDGECTVSASDIAFTNVDGVKVTPIVDAFNITIDTKTKVSYPINVEYINQEQNKGFILEKPQPETSTVNFDIGQKKKEEIGTVKEIIDLSEIKDVNEKEHQFEAQVKVYDKSGNILNTYTDLPTIEIKQPFSVGTQEKVVKYNILNNNTGKYISAVCRDKIKKGCQDSVEVYGDADKIADIDSITYDVDMKDYNIKNRYIMAQPILDSGVYIKDDGNFKVEINLESGIEKTLKGIPITVMNLNSTFNIPAIKDGTVNLKLQGAKSVIDELTENQIMVYVDAKDIKAAGEVTLPIQTNIPSYVASVLSKKEIKIKFTEKDDVDTNKKKK